MTQHNTDYFWVLILLVILAIGLLFVLSNVDAGLSLANNVTPDKYCVSSTCWI